MNKKVKTAGRKLTYILRHNPTEFDITLEKLGGWAKVNDVLNALKISMGELESIVEEDNKGRFLFNTDKTKIKAVQGHSIEVILDLIPIKPPETLYHGTVEKYFKWIEREGLKSMGRNFVHLSEDLETANIVARRRDTKPVILKVFSEKMFDDGYDFYQAENGVWLVEKVPPEYFVVEA